MTVLPVACDGCSANPSTPDHNPVAWGGHVPPHGPPDAPLAIVAIVPVMTLPPRPQLIQR